MENFLRKPNMYGVKMIVLITKKAAGPWSLVLNCNFNLVFEVKKRK